MNLYGLRKMHEEERKALTAKYYKAVKERLIECHLDGLVRRKKDGKIGWLWVEIDVGRITVKFHPMKKDGTPSINASGWSFDVEHDFEPYEEGGTNEADN